MKTFTIDADNNITAHASAEEAEAVADAGRFSTTAELAELAASWPGERLVEIWNSLPGATPVKKFTDRKTAIARIWKAIEHLGEPAAAERPSVAARAPRVAAAKGQSGKKAKRAKPAHKARPKAEAVRDGSKKAEVLELLRRARGATLAEIMKKTGWQAHTVRGFVSGTLIKKLGLNVESFRTEDKERTYRITG